MPDDTQTGAQAAAGTQLQASDAAHDATQTQQTQQQQQQSQADTQQQQQQQQANGNSSNGAATKPTLEDLLATVERQTRELAETRKEAAAHRVKAKQLDDKLKAEADAQLSETERAKKATDDAEKRVGAFRDRIGRSEIKLAATAAGIIDPDDAVMHLVGKVAYDDDGEPQAVAKLVADLKASKPHLFGAKPDAAAQRAAQEAAAGAAMGATNGARASGPVTITADQYLDRAYQKDFRTRYGVDVATAVRQGKAQLV